MTDYVERLVRAFQDLNAVAEEHEEATPSPVRDAATALLTPEMIFQQVDRRWLRDDLSDEELTDFVAFVGSAFTMGVQVGWKAALDG